MEAVIRASTCSPLCSALLVRETGAIRSDPSMFLPLRLAEAPAAAASRTSRPAVGFAGNSRRVLRARSAYEDSSKNTVEQFGFPSKTDTEGVKATTTIESDDENPHVATEEVPTVGQLDFINFLNQTNLKLNSEDLYSTLTYGTGALAALWISSAIIGAIDSLPLFPKVMEVIGLGFTLWFTYRYLIFKRNRDELLEKIEDLKEQIFGQSMD